MNSVIKPGTKMLLSLKCIHSLLATYFFKGRFLKRKRPFYIKILLTSR